MSPIQPGILDPVLGSRATSCSISSPRPALDRRCADWFGRSTRHCTVVGLGRSIPLALGREVPGLRDFEARSGAGIEVPSTPAALWCWLRGEDRGELVHRARSLAAAVAPGFVLEAILDAFRHGDGRDLTGYEDGTENPEGDAAVEAAELDGAEARARRLELRRGAAVAARFRSIRRDEPH